MRKLNWLLAAACLILQNISSSGLDAPDYAFLLSAQVAANPPRIAISWPAKDTPAIYVRRKLVTDRYWGPAVTTLPGNATSFVDSNVEAGAAYEYEFKAQIAELPENQFAYGYIAAGAQLPAVEKRGKVALIVDSTVAAGLGGELETLRLDLIGDGWNVVRHDVSRYSSPPEVKAVIKADYDADRENMRAVFLIGHVPVPYSGLINPDMHVNHLGAWPADVYYGEMDGSWTDFSVNKNDCEYADNNNVPGDGKFDQATIPGEVELEVGRIDLSNLPAFAPRSEIDLLKNYFRKNHAFRVGALSAPARGLVRDNFGVISEDAPATDAWRSFPNMLGLQNVQEIGPDTFFPILNSQAYLWAYAGGGGDWEKADGVGSTTDFVTGDPKAIFYLLHGSYFGDWNNQDNFLRAALATPNYGLVSIWSSLPHWYFHHMALGETIGYATRLTQNNREGVYRNQEDLSIGEVHTSMMGDPTLRAFPIAPPTNPRLSETDVLTLNWDASPQAVEGYNVYWARSFEGPWSRMNRRTVTGTSFEQSIPSSGHYVYMVKAAALQTTGSGTFNNLSQGIFIEYDSPIAAVPEVSVAADDSVGDENGDYIVFRFSRDAGLESPLSVNVQLAGTAVAGQDYPAQPATVVFPVGSSTTSWTIHPTQDGLLENDETIALTLLGGAGYRLGFDTAQAIIKGSAISQIDASVVSSAGTEGGDPIVFQFARNAGLESALTVNLQFSGTASAGQDYIAPPSTIQFPAGEATATLSIAPLQDNVNELDETVVVTVAPGPFYTVGAESATGTIKASGSSLISEPGISAAGFGFDASGFASHPYRVESRPPDGSWRMRANGISGPDGAISYRETTPPGGVAEFYRVVWE